MNMRRACYANIMGLAVLVFLAAPGFGASLTEYGKNVGPVDAELMLYPSQSVEETHEVLVAYVYDISVKESESPGGKGGIFGNLRETHTAVLNGSGNWAMLAGHGDTSIRDVKTNDDRADRFDLTDSEIQVLAKVMPVSPLPERLGEFAASAQEELSAMPAVHGTTREYERNLPDASNEFRFVNTLIYQVPNQSVANTQLTYILLLAFVVLLLCPEGKKLRTPHHR